MAEKKLTELSPMDRAKRVAKDIYSRIPEAISQYQDPMASSASPKVSREQLQTAGEMGAEFLYPPAGIALSVRDIGQGIAQGSKPLVAAGALGLLPGVTSAGAKAAVHHAGRRVPQYAKHGAESLRELREGVARRVSGPEKVRTYHTTPHKFDEFDPQHANPMGAYGASPAYTTTDYFDSAVNYGKTGPDRQHAVDAHARMLRRKGVDSNTAEKLAAQKFHNATPAELAAGKNPYTTMAVDATVDKPLVMDPSGVRRTTQLPTQKLLTNLRNQLDSDLERDSFDKWASRLELEHGPRVDAKTVYDSITHDRAAGMFMPQEKFRKATEAMGYDAIVAHPASRFDMQYVPDNAYHYMFNDPSKLTVNKAFSQPTPTKEIIDHSYHRSRNKGKHFFSPEGNK